MKTALFLVMVLLLVACGGRQQEGTTPEGEVAATADSNETDTSDDSRDLSDENEHTSSVVDDEGDDWEGDDEEGNDEEGDDWEGGEEGDEGDYEDY